MDGLEIHPLTPRRWDDLEKLFGKRGACGGCWCMTWRLTRREYDESKGEANRLAFRSIVKAGPPPGLLAYLAGDPVGWCAVGPRDSFPALDRSRILKRIDDQPVWSIPCLFVAKAHRRQGVSTALLRGCAAFAKAGGAHMLEGYPVDPKKPDMPDLFAFTGTLTAFLKAGFREVLRRSETRPIVRQGLR